MFEQMTPALKQNRSSIISSDCCVSNQHCLMNTSPQRILSSHPQWEQAMKPKALAMMRLCVWFLYNGRLIKSLGDQVNKESQGSSQQMAGPWCSVGGWLNQKIKSGVINQSQLTESARFLQTSDHGREYLYYNVLKASVTSISHFII